jgi:hypothetical protein
VERSDTHHFQLAAKMLGFANGSTQASTAFPKFLSYRHRPGPHPRGASRKRCVSKDGHKRRPCKLPSFEEQAFALRAHVSVDIIGCGPNEASRKVRDSLTPTSLKPVASVERSDILHS